MNSTNFYSIGIESQLIGLSLLKTKDRIAFLQSSKSNYALITELAKREIPSLINFVEGFKSTINKEKYKDELNQIDDHLKSPEFQSASLSHLDRRKFLEKKIATIFMNKIGDESFNTADLKDNKALMLMVISECPPAIQLVSEKLKNDKEIIMQAIYFDPWAIQYASRRLRGCKEVVEAAVLRHQSGGTLQYASKRFKNDKELVLKASPEAFRFASKKLRKDKEFVMKILSKDLFTSSLGHAAKKLRNDKDVVKAAIKAKKDAMFYASPELQRDEELLNLLPYNFRWRFKQS